MSAQYLWYTVLDVVTSPVAWTAFGAGILFTLAVLAAYLAIFGRELMIIWAAGCRALAEELKRERQPEPQPAKGDPVQVALIVDAEWESPSTHNRWLNVTHRSSLSPYMFHAVNEETQNTEMVQLTEPVARSLANWLNQHLKGVQP